MRLIRKKTTTKKAPTKKEEVVTQIGLKRYTCKDCGHVVRTENLPKLAPVKPNVKSSTTYKTVKLSWKKVKEAKGYQVYRATKGSTALIRR